MLLSGANIGNRVVTPGKERVQRFPQLFPEVIRIDGGRCLLCAVASRLGSRVLLASASSDGTRKCHADRQTNAPFHLCSPVLDRDRSRRHSSLRLMPTPHIAGFNCNTSSRVRCALICSASFIRTQSQARFWFSSVPPTQTIPFVHSRSCLTRSSPSRS